MGIISRIIGYPLGWVMWLAYQLCSNYALAIVIFTLFTKLILFPISVKTQKNSAAMAAFSPKLEKLKKKYANNPQKLQEATMELYAEENINPMSSCLPLLIQFPILYGIFDVVYRPITHIMRVGSDVIEQATEICKNIAGYGDQAYFQHRPEIYITQAIKDPLVTEKFASLPAEAYEKILNFNNTLFGFIDLNKTPTFSPESGWTAEAAGLIIIPILSGVFQLISSVYSNVRQKKLNPEASAQMGSMNAMMYIMPIFSVWIALSYPAGIGFYWTISAALSFVSMVVLNKVYTPEYVAKLIEKDKKKRKNKNKSSMMQRYQQLMAEQNGAAQNSSGSVARGKLSDSDDAEVRLSKSQQKDMESRLISENRKKFEEKYSGDNDDLSENEIKLLEEARRRQAAKYGDN